MNIASRWSRTIQHQRRAQAQRAARPLSPNYKWIALTNTTLGALMASIDSACIDFAPCNF